MASYNKLQVFVADLANKSHNLGSDQLAVALTDTLPTAGMSTVPGEIAYTNFTPSGVSATYITTTSSTQTSGLYKLILANLVLTANGTIPQFRYVVILNRTSSKVIAWFDYGSEVNMVTGDQFAVNFDATNGLLQIT